jgi:ribose transport system permease protein
MNPAETRPQVPGEAAPLTAQSATMLRTAPRRFDVRRALRTYSFIFSAVLAGALLVATLLTEQGGFGLTNQLADAAPLTIAALASAPAIIGGGFDLSISPLIFFVNAVYVVWLAPHGLGGAISIPIVLALAIATSTLSGIITVTLRIPAIVVTLAMFFALQGVDLLIAPNPVSMTQQNGWITHLAGSVGPLPGGAIMIGLPLVIWFALRYVPFRRLLYAVGSNDATAFSSGVNVGGVRVASYALGGLFAGFAGLSLTALTLSTDASQSTEYTLVAIAAVVLGGTSLAGGRGGLVGVLFGAFSIYLLQNLLATLQVNSAYLQILYGGILILAVVIQGAFALQGHESGARGRFAVDDWLHRRRSGWKRAADGAPITSVAPQDRAGSPTGSLATKALAADGMPGTVRAWRALTRAQRRFPLLQVLAVAVVFTYGALTLPGLASWVGIRTILVLAAIVGLASCGQTLLILMGGFDLGVSGFIVAGALTVTALNLKYNISFVEALVFALVGAAILGAFAGYVCHRFKINPLVMTLAMGTLAVGLVEVQNGGVADGNSPMWLATLAEPAAKTFGLPIPPAIAIWVLVIVLFALFLHRTKLGRNLLATGANPRAAEYALINTRRVWMAAFAFSAATSALVGVLIAGFAGTVVTTLGDPYLFQSVVAVIVGGTVFGGPGDYTRTSLGALFLTILVTVLVGHGASAALEEIVYGGIILVAVAIYGRDRRIRDRV